MARTILVVEDEPTLRETLVEALEADGFRVVAAADGREALTRFRADRLAASGHGRAYAYRTLSVDPR